MNSYDKHFFKKYIIEGNEILDVVHQHIIVILGKIIVNFVVLVGLPTFLFYFSDKLKMMIPFFAFEGYLLIMFIKICYDILDWYNDVWIITQDSLIDLDWSLFNTTSQTLKYENIEGLEINQEGIIDTILGKGEIVASKVGGDSFILEDAANIYKISEKIDNASKDFRHDEMDEEEEYDETNDVNHFGHSSYDDSKIDKLIEVLSGMIEGQMGEKKSEEEIEKLKETIDNARKNKGTIDLR